MKRDRSEMGRALANIDQQICELQRARQILIDARGPTEAHVKRWAGEPRKRRTKAEMAAATASVPS